MKSRTVSILFSLLAGLCLTACASLAPYGPQQSASGQGFSEQRIESDRFRVTYRGVGAPGPVADMALLRAAQLTTEQGFDWFIVTQRYVDGRPDSAGGMRPTLSVGYGASNFGGWRASGTGVGVGVDFSGPSPTSTILEVRMGRGGQPPEAEVYDAREVQASLGR